ncbi:hypothetical protein N175_12210 [Vibrio anguillarum M3]|nr:hypothetical protein N175_12210 [Vibrio anguillarum M3]
MAYEAFDKGLDELESKLKNGMEVVRRSSIITSKPQGGNDKRSRCIIELSMGFVHSAFLFFN